MRELLSTECLSWNENFQEDSSGLSSDSRPVSSAETGFSDAVGDDIQLLREYVSTLTPLQYDVYSAMLLKYEGGGLWITDAELAEKWGVHPTFILYERKKIISGIRTAVGQGDQI